MILQLEFSKGRNWYSTLMKKQRSAVSNRFMLIFLDIVLRMALMAFTILGNDFGIKNKNRRSLQ